MLVTQDHRFSGVRTSTQPLKPRTKHVDLTYHVPLVLALRALLGPSDCFPASTGWQAFLHCLQQLDGLFKEQATHSTTDKYDLAQSFDHLLLIHSTPLDLCPPHSRGAYDGEGPCFLYCPRIGLTNILYQAKSELATHGAKAYFTRG